MGLIRQAAASFLKDAIVLDLGDLAAQGERMRVAAEAHARGLVQEATKERQRILAAAAGEGRKDGFEEGRKQGLEAGRAEGRAAAVEEFRARFAELEKAWLAALGDFESQRRTMLIDARRDLLELAVEIATRVTKRTVTANAAAAEQLESVLMLVTRPTRLLVRVNPEDEPLLRDALPGLVERFPKAEHVELKGDVSVSRGSCIARTAGGGVIDASIETQLERVAAAIVTRSDGAAEPPTAETDAEERP